MQQYYQVDTISTMEYYSRMSQTLKQLRHIGINGEAQHCKLMASIDKAVQTLCALIDERGHGSGLDIAAQLGCSPSMLSHILHGDRSLSPSMLRRIAELK